MTFKDLRRAILEEQQSSYNYNSPEMQKLLKECENIPFWPNDTWHKYSLKPIKTASTNRYMRPHLCCFNHIIGLPEKDGIKKPLFEYEYSILYRALMWPSYINSFLSNRENNAKLLERLQKEQPEIYKTLNRTNTQSEKHAIEKVRDMFPLFPFKVKHLWVKKATGLGVTEFMLRMMAWLCLRNDDMKGAQMVIITGPNQDIAIKLIRRLKGLFEREPHNIRAPVTQ